MRGWLIFAAVVLVLFLLGQVKVGVWGEYGAQGVTLRLRLGAVRVTVLPRGPKAAKEKKPKKTSSQKPEEGAPKGDKPKPGLGGALAYARALLPILLEAAGCFYRRLRVDRLRLELRVGGADPADVALLYGQASAALGAFWYPLTQAFHVVDGSARVEPDFNSDGMTLYAQTSLSLRLGQILWLGLYFGIKSLKAVLSVRKQQKTEQRKAV